MIGKAVASLVIFLVTVFITYSITAGDLGSGGGFGTLDLKSQFSFFSLPKNDSPLPCRSGSPLRVFMYDLPKRFNVGMLSSKFAGSDDSPLNAGNLPLWPQHPRLQRQHSVEYWMMASLLNENGTVEESSEAVRVLNPEVADVFFVPFFSSLSFNTHGKNMTDPDTEFDRQLQVDILKFLRKSKYYQRTSGRDHVIPMHHPNAFRFLREEVNASILIVADFGRFSKSMSTLQKDVVAPYKHVVESFMDDDSSNPYKLRTTLLFFRGRTVRKSVDILKFLRKSKYYQRTSGRDHVIPMHHPNAFRFLREEVNASILIVADFGRFSKSMSTLQKDVVAPYKHVVESFMDDDSSNPYKLRTTLLFFRGRTVRKSEGKVRRKLEKLLKGYEDVHFEASYATEEGINAGMRSSKFCLHPAGDTPSSNRLFDAIVSHCVPVVISDHIELPFESELDYTKFSLFFSVKEALVPGYMVEHLRKIPENEWLKMWTRLKEITHHFEYQFPPKKEDAVNMIWRQVRSKVPGERLAVNRMQRLKIPDWW